MSDMKNPISHVNKQNEKFVVIGLTGRTGSGCTTTAKILSDTNFPFPEASRFHNSQKRQKQYSIVRDYLLKRWNAFTIIEVRAILTLFITKHSFDEFCSFVTKQSEHKIGEVKGAFNEIKDLYDEFHEKTEAYASYVENEDIWKEKIQDEKYCHLGVLFLQSDLPKLCTKMKEIFSNKLDKNTYSKIYQAVGDNIRSSGNAFEADFNPDKIFEMPNIINRIIKMIGANNKFNKIEKTLIVIDAIRNPYEATFFHQRYSHFFLFSINTPNQARINHLRENHKLSDEQIKVLDGKEYPSKLDGTKKFTSQNIQKCIEIADIHINNPNRDEHDTSCLKAQLCWYISLIFHPGLVAPSPYERGMQIAYTAKLNSGCISRQVGAVITDSNHSVKAIGWNDAPAKQTSCTLRSASELMDSSALEHCIIYSKFEREDDAFREQLNKEFSNEKVNALRTEGLSDCYCFKDIYNETNPKKRGNQVHTRSLHAEENAFLQITKYGGQGIEGGLLFSTASPCELCSKKAYHLGISEIIYVDPYPGIANDHILRTGEHVPKLRLFSGAIGHAYHKLYQPLMSYKDEMDLYLRVYEK